MSVQLSDLGKRIMLDRYAMKDLERKVALGDTVVYRIDGDTRWGIVDTITNIESEAKLGIREFDDSSSLIYLSVDQVDRCLETTWEQIMNRVVEGLREKTTVTTGINSTSVGVGAGMLNSLYTNGKRETDMMWNRMQEILNEQRFVPAGRILAGCGTDQELTFYNCFVLPSPEDSRHGIFKTLDQMAEIMSRGGGVGINLATLRPQRAPVYGVNGRSSGSVSWGGLYSFVTGLIEQGGSRRGALMLILPVWHPDIEQFIESKTTAGKIENANISVAITDDFMRAVENDSDWYLVFPDYKTVSNAKIDWTYDEEWDGNLSEWIAGGGPTKTYKKVRARDLWEKIMQSAWASAEPGIWFIDRANKLSPSWGYGGPHLSIATNPCQPGWATVLTPEGIRQIDDIKVGDTVWSGTKWTTLINKSPSGIKTVRSYETFYGTFYGTKKHRIIQNGDPVELKEATSIDVCCPSVLDSVEWIPNLVMDGLVLGDGQCKADNRRRRDGSKRPGTMLLCVGKDDQDYFTSEVAHLIGAQFGGKDKQYNRKIITSFTELPRTFNREIPDRFRFGTSQEVCSFLRGIFSANGTASGNHSISLNLSSFKVIQSVQEMLSSLGIYSKWNKRKPATVDFKKGKGPRECKPIFTLRISPTCVERFKNLIGFLQVYKNENLEQLIEKNREKQGTKRHISAQIGCITDLGKHQVWDLTVESEEHTYWSSGLLSKNCGEQNLPGWAVCNLGHINLSQHVYGPIGRAKIDWAKLEETIILSVNFLDRIIDVTGYYSRESYDKQMDYRRVGLGTLGLGEMLVRCGYIYGSSEGNDFISELYEKICDIAWETSCKLGKQKGSHGIFDQKKFEASEWFQKIHGRCRRFREAYDSYPAMRNITVLTQAPCGTVATMIGTTTGIEPYFAFSNTRVSRLGTHKEVAGVVKEWENSCSKAERERWVDLPDYFVTTMDLTPLQHVKVQALIQMWTDTSISKTVNLPNSATIDQVREVYEYMYQMGCKGGTVYRDGSRSEQVLYTEKISEQQIQEVKEAVKKVEDKFLSSQAFDLEKVKQAGKVFEVQKASKFGRKGTTMSRPSPSGIVHIIMNDDDNGNPFECFVEVGKSGSEVKGLSEALGRLISIVMRMPSSMDSKAKVMEVINQLEGIGGMSSIGAGPNRSLSIPDSVADALNTRYFDSPDLDPEDPAHPVYALLENPQRVNADLCPKCHNSGLTRSEGCQVCINCGHSACG